MIKIGITGSLASGKTTASKIISKNKGPLFSADKAVKKLYSNKVLRKTIAKPDPAALSNTTALPLRGARSIETD